MPSTMELKTAPVSTGPFIVAIPPRVGRICGERDGSMSLEKIERGYLYIDIIPLNGWVE